MSDFSTSPFVVTDDKNVQVKRGLVESVLLSKPRSRPRTIAVWGPAGSPGRSTVAINLAESLARRGKRVLLADLDLFNPSIALMLGRARSGHTLSTFFAALQRDSPVLISEYVSETAIHGLFLLPGIAASYRWQEIPIELFAAFLDSAERFEHIVFDVAGDLHSNSSIGPERISKFLIREVDLVVAVGVANILGIERLANHADSLRRLRQNRPLSFVLNGIESKPGSTGRMKELFRQLTKEKFVATLPFDRKTLSVALELGCTAAEVRQRGDFCKAMSALATILVTP